MWQEVVHGFGGLVNALSTDILTFKPCIPEQIKEVSFRIIWKGKQVAVTVTADKVLLKNLSNNEISFKVHDNDATVEANKDITVTY